jgi:hypothetical protein
MIDDMVHFLKYTLCIFHPLQSFWFWIIASDVICRWPVKVGWDTRQAFMSVLVARNHYKMLIFLYFWVSKLSGKPLSSRILKFQRLSNMTRKRFDIHFTRIRRRAFQGRIFSLILNAIGHKRMDQIGFVFDTRHLIWESGSKSTHLHTCLIGTTWLEVEIWLTAGNECPSQLTSHRTDESRPGSKGTNFGSD